MKLIRPLATIALGVLGNFKIPLLGLLVDLDSIARLSWLVSISFLLSLIQPRYSDEIDRYILVNGSPTIRFDISVVFSKLVYINLLITLLVLLAGLLGCLRPSEMILVILLLFSFVLTQVANSVYKFRNDQLLFNTFYFVTSILAAVPFIMHLNIELWLIYIPNFLVPLVYILTYSSVRLKFKGVFDRDLIRMLLRTLPFNLAKFAGDYGLIFLSGIYLNSADTALLTFCRVFTSPVRQVITYSQNLRYNAWYKGVIASLRLERYITLVVAMVLLLGLYLYTVKIGSDKEPINSVILGSFFILNYMVMFTRIEIDILIHRYSLYSVRNISAVFKVVFHLSFFAMFSSVYGIVLGLLTSTIFQKYTFDKIINQKGSLNV